MIINSDALPLGGIKIEVADGFGTSDTSAGDEAAMRAAAIADATFGDYADTVYSGIRDRGLAIADRTAIGLTSDNCLNFYDTANVWVYVYKVKFSIKAPNLPVRILYDIIKDTDGTPSDHLTDQEILISSSNPEEEVEIPLIESTDPVLVATYMTNVRLFFCPYHTSAAT